ncbi:hypothetical protein OPV22_027464 [Ensete ventricosum]|uniref:Knottins-like domain-containing protein n=1 Tax=Ensete ventricosum TaxID=4639 RepID=A0AAV8P319_ENSVE|nr:hypothetical protein OPV22_027464 [Ensete ventricosum]RWW19019.1 hypothetical protein GW17_00016958 [Ensete ventricosum]RWW68629.1 hypothetical protein BHE74_00023840 [Ensete ventricosum]RZR76225.1 hypothetical protein BHM03_00000878 [Ensete ventricosum]
MASSRRMLPPVLLLLFLLVASETGTTVVNARTCESRSQKFAGSCMEEVNCRNVCRTEGFYSGVCHGSLFHRKCYCTKKC